MRKLLPFMILLPLMSVAQPKKFFTAAIGIEQNKELGFGGMGQAAGGVKFWDMLYTGIGVGVTKFGKTDGYAMVPAFVKLMFVDSKTTGLMISLEPGYIVNPNGYQMITTQNTRKKKYNAGPYYNISAGIKLNKDKGKSPFISFGYSVYDFPEWQPNAGGTWRIKPQKYSAFSARLGIAL